VVVPEIEAERAREQRVRTERLGFRRQGIATHCNIYCNNTLQQLAAALCNTSEREREKESER